MINVQELVHPVNILGARDEFVMRATHEGDMEVIVRKKIDEINVLNLKKVYYVPTA